MARVARRDRRAASERDSGDLRIAEIDRPPLLLALGRQVGGRERRVTIEVEHTILEVFFKQPIEARFQRTAPSAETAQAEANLEQRDDRDPHRLGRLPIQPGDDRRFRRLAHQGRKDVGVEDDHLPKSGGRGDWPRSIGRSSLKPPFANRAAIRLYERLGFHPIGSNGVYLLMERTPDIIT